MRKSREKKSEASLEAILAKYLSINESLPPIPKLSEEHLAIVESVWSRGRDKIISEIAGEECKTQCAYGFEPENPTVDSISAHCEYTAENEYSFVPKQIQTPIVILRRDHRVTYRLRPIYQMQRNHC